MDWIVKTQNLSKQIKKRPIISNVNMRIKKGEIYGLLGPNGAGKTTIMKLLLNLIHADQGSIEIFGEMLTPNSVDMFKRISAIIEYPIFYEKLTAQENLFLHCSYMGYYNVEEIETVLRITGLTDIKNKKVKEFSLGMKQRLGIARAILTKPELMILDEPINGLDPLGISEIRSLLKKMNQEYGISIMISSHILNEIEQMADTIGVIKEGHLIEEVAMEKIKESAEEFLEIKVNDARKASYILSEKFAFKNFKTLDEKTIRIYEKVIGHNDFLTRLMSEDLVIESLTTRQRAFCQVPFYVYE
ncbi:MAG: ATP-binding cassette domain-containing protein [Peptostreptococcaceae bacterium]|nr:ATP-binding cassette domain-containing protein [Peptostreptococcaceae bacterium]